MADTNRLKLRQQLVENYDDLFKHLTRRLGSSEFAYEALHESVVRLDGVPQTTEVRSPADCIFRTTINIAKYRRKARSYGVSAMAIEALIDASDETLDPARTAETRSDFKAFEWALLELPERQRHVLRMMPLEGKTRARTPIALAPIEIQSGGPPSSLGKQAALNLRRTSKEPQSL